MKKVPRSREEKEVVPLRRGRQRLPLIPDQKASLALWAPPAESVDGTAAFCYNYIAMNMEMYRSGRNENDSKSNWLFGSGFPILLGFMRVFRLRERTIFGRSLLKFSPKFSQNARSILKFNIWSITQVVVRGRTRNHVSTLEVQTAEKPVTMRICGQVQIVNWGLFYPVVLPNFHGLNFAGKWL